MGSSFERMRKPLVELQSVQAPLTPLEPHQRSLVDGLNLLDMSDLGALDSELLDKRGDRFDFVLEDIAPDRGAFSVKVRGDPEPIMRLSRAATPIQHALTVAHETVHARRFLEGQTDLGLSAPSEDAYVDEMIVEESLASAHEMQVARELLPQVSAVQRSELLAKSTALRSYFKHRYGTDRPSPELIARDARTGPVPQDVMDSWLGKRDGEVAEVYEQDLRERYRAMKAGAPR